MPQAFDVCVRGAGIVGRALALLLARDRLRVALVATPPIPASGVSDVRAYAMNNASRDLLLSLRSWPDAEHATPVLAMNVHGDDGGVVNFHAPGPGDDGLAWIVDVPALQARLVEAVRYQPLIEVVDAPQPAALTVICEGKASTTRSEFGVDYNVTPYAQHAIACRLTCEEPHRQAARQWFADGEIMAFLPLGGAAGNLVAVVWSVPEDRVAGLMALGAADFAERLEAASHGALGKLALQGDRAVWPLQLARASRWVGSRAGKGWALAGDAAHTVHPLAGQGLNLGLADAAELAAVLHGREYWRGVGDEKLLRRYERARKADVLRMAVATDGLQQLFSHAGAPWQALRNWGMKGFERSGPFKTWVARQAMGLRQN
ncbi:MAG: FAD-dependent monooxygenase [Burkholderiaceae bacterium]|nr:FAD-dependent monooxygenase [Burkholderiaceae bacterium]